MFNGKMNNVPLYVLGKTEDDIVLSYFCDTSGAAILSYFCETSAEYMQANYFQDYNIYIKIGDVIELYRGHTQSEEIEK